MNSSPPDLQALVAAAGGYEKISPETWAAFDHAMAGWRAERREILRREALTKHDDGDPALDVVASAGPQRWPYQGCDQCGAEARFGYRSNGDLRWVCAKHRVGQCWADARRWPERKKSQ
jgi:hypothetical protein